MRRKHYETSFVNFNDAAIPALRDLVLQVGVCDSLELFLSTQLTQVLRRQNDTSVLSHITFLSAGNCVGKGNMSSSDILIFNSLAIPMDLRIGVITDQGDVELTVRLTLNAVGNGESYELTTDLLVLRDEAV